MCKSVFRLLCIVILFYSQVTLAIKIGVSLPDCSVKMAAGDWCEIAGSELSKIALTKETALPNTWGHSGAKSIIEAWTGMATDGQYYYLTGGGHSDYGGNEIYRYDPIANKTIQLTPQSPMTHVMLYTPNKKGQIGVNEYCLAPDIYNVPSSTHTYDGIEYNKTTNELIVAVYGMSNHSCFLVNENDPVSVKQLDPYTLIESKDSGGIYALNLESLVWRKIYSYSDSKDYVIRTEFRGDDNMFYFGNRTYLYYGYVEADKPITVLGKTISLASAGDGVLVWDKRRKHFWSDHSNIIWKMDRDANLTGRTDPPMTKRSNRNFVMDESNGQYIKWNGSELLRVYTPETDTWCEEKTNAGRQYPADYTTSGRSWMVFEAMQRLYTKFQYMPEYDVFIGINRFDLPWVVHKRSHSCGAKKTLAKNTVIPKPHTKQALIPKSLTLAQRVKILRSKSITKEHKPKIQSFSIPKNDISYGSIPALQAMGLLPKYGLATYTAKPDLDLDWGGQGGERDEIGLFTEQHAAFIAGQKDLKDSILERALAPPPDTRSDFAHHPNEFWLPYLLTGNPVYISNLEKTYKQYRAWRSQTLDSAIIYGTEREGAWNLRDLVQLAFLEKRGLTTQKVYIKALNATRDRWLAKIANPNTEMAMFNTLDFNTIYGGSYGWTEWMQSMLGQAVNYTATMTKDAGWKKVAAFHFQHLLKASGDEWPLKALGSSHVFFSWYTAKGTAASWAEVGEVTKTATWQNIHPYHPSIYNTVEYQALDPNHIAPVQFRTSADIYVMVPPNRLQYAYGWARLACYNAIARACEKANEIQNEINRAGYGWAFKNGLL